MFKSYIYILKKAVLFSLPPGKLNFEKAPFEHMEDGAVVEGWLEKADSLGHSTFRKALGVQTWKKRYFILRNSEITYFDRKPTANDLSCPPRSWTKVTLVKWWEFEGSPAIEILCVHGKSIFCAACDANEAHKWINAYAGVSGESAVRISEQGKMLKPAEIEALWTVDKRLSMEVSMTSYNFAASIFISVSCLLLFDSVLVVQLQIWFNTWAKDVSVLSLCRLPVAVEQCCTMCFFY
jgi:hypothetical protein